MDKIICLVGASGSGKTTIAKKLDEMGYNVIQSYTTRPPREPNEWGHTFTNESPVTEYEVNAGGLLVSSVFKLNDNVIAYFKNYNAEYWAIKEQYQGKGTSIYIIDPKGAEEVKKNVKDAEVVTIFLLVDENERFHRLENSRGFHEAIERIEKDREIFKKVKCDYVIDGNRELNDVLEDILEVLENTKEVK